MNERINKLFGQALDEIVPDTWTNLTMDQLNDIKNRFAELIVRECIDYCGENLSKTVGGALKIHFGVEE